MIASKIPDQLGAKFQPYNADECPNQDCFSRIAVCILHRRLCEPRYLRALMDDAPEV